MASIQMVNDEIIDVTESEEEIYGEIIRCAHNVPIIKLTAKDDVSEAPIYINASQISSFM